MLASVEGLNASYQNNIIFDILDFSILHEAQLNNSYHTLLDVSQLSILVPFVIGIIRFRQLKAWQSVLLYLVTTVIFTEISATLIKVYITPTNNLIAYNICLFVSFLLAGFIYIKQLRSPSLKLGVKAILFSFVPLSMLNIAFIQPIDTYNTNMILFSYLSFNLFALAYFYQSLRELKGISWKKNPFFWFNTGVLIYYSTALILFLFVNQIIASSTETIEQCWSVNAAIYIVLNLFFAISLWKRDQVSLN